MTGAHWNRSARRSGGARPVKIYVPVPIAEDIEIARQREAIRKEFGGAGVKRFDEDLLKKALGKK